MILTGVKDKRVSGAQELSSQLNMLGSQFSFFRCLESEKLKRPQIHTLASNLSKFSTSVKLLFPPSPFPRIKAAPKRNTQNPTNLAHET